MHARPLFAAALLSGLLAFWTAGCRTTSDRVGGRGGHSDFSMGVPRDPEPGSAHAEALAHFATGISLELNEDPAGAMEHFREAASAEPTETDLVLDVARRYIEQKQFTQAIEILERAARERAPSADVLSWLGLVYSQAGRKPEAIAASRKAVGRDPAAIVAYQTLVQLSLAQLEWNAAVKWAGQAARVHIEDPAYLLQVADLYLTILQKRPELKERVHKAHLDVVNRLEASKSENPAVQQRLGDHLRALGELARAEAVYIRLIEKYPSPLLRERLTDIYLRTNRKDLATAQLEAIKREFPANPNVYFVLGGLAADDRRWEDAAGHFENSIRLNPEFEQAYYELAGVRISMNKAAEALELLEKARSKFKAGFTLEFYAGLARMQMKDYASAVKSLVAAEAVARESEPSRLTPSFLFQVGAAHERAGEHEKAVGYFRTCIELSPKFAEALNYLGYMWAEKGENLPEARRFIERALRIEPENPAFLDSLGWVHFKLGNPREALGWIQKAVAKTEEPDATLHDHLGDIYAALNETAKAREAWSKSLSIEVNESVKAKLEQPPVRRSR